MNIKPRNSSLTRPGWRRLSATAVATCLLVSLIAIPVANAASSTTPGLAASFVNNHLIVAKVTNFPPNAKIRFITFINNTPMATAATTTDSTGTSSVYLNAPMYSPLPAIVDARAVGAKGIVELESKLTNKPVAIAPPASSYSANTNTPNLKGAATGNHLMLVTASGFPASTPIIIYERLGNSSVKNLLTASANATTDPSGTSSVNLNVQMFYNGLLTFEAQAGSKAVVKYVCKSGSKYQLQTVPAGTVPSPSICNAA